MRTVLAVLGLLSWADAGNVRAATQVPTPVLGCGLACNSVTLVVDCWNVSGCGICGTGLYDCPSSTSCCAFSDPCANGMVVQQVGVNVYGTACTSPTTCFSTSLNGTVVGSTSSTAYTCVCNACTVWSHVSGCYGGGFPGYAYGGANNLCYVPCGYDQICLDRMDVTICCVLPQSPTPTITCPPTLSRTCTAWNTNTISRTFTISPTPTRTPSITSTHSPTPIVCAPTCVGNVSNGGFESGSTSGWVFSTTCTSGGSCYGMGCAAAVPQGPQGGCQGPGMCCCSNPSFCCPGLFDQVACGSYAAAVWSGDGGGLCGGQTNSVSQLCRTVSIPAGGATLSFYYAASLEICGSGSVSFSATSSGCSPAINWTVALTSCLGWTLQTFNLPCGGPACTVAICGEATYGGSCSAWAFLDELSLCPSCTWVTITPTATATVSPTATATRTDSPTRTVSETQTESSTPTVSATASSTPLPTEGPSSTDVPTETASPSRTPTATPTQVPPFFHVDRNELQGTSDPLGLRFLADRDGPASLTVWNAAGEHVATLFDQPVSGQQVYAVTWNGRNDRGEPVSSNVYLVRLEAPGLHRFAKVGVTR